nr:hypothetical protein [Actinomadura pelletieri]
MRDDEGGSALAGGAHCLLDVGFAFGIEVRDGFVEDEDGGVGEDGTGDGDALALSSGEAGAGFAEESVVPSGRSRVMKVGAQAARAACSTSVSVASGRARRMLSRTVRAKR